MTTANIRPTSTPTFPEPSTMQKIIGMLTGVDPFVTDLHHEEAYHQLINLFHGEGNIANRIMDFAQAEHDRGCSQYDQAAIEQCARAAAFAYDIIVRAKGKERLILKMYVRIFKYLPDINGWGNTIPFSVLRICDLHAAVLDLQDLLYGVRISKKV